MRSLNSCFTYFWVVSSSTNFLNKKKAFRFFKLSSHRFIFSVWWSFAFLLQPSNFLTKRSSLSDLISGLFVITIAVQSKNSFGTCSENMSTKPARIDLKRVGVLVCFYSIIKIIDILASGIKIMFVASFASKFDHNFL